MPSRTIWHLWNGTVTVPGLVEEPSWENSMGERYWGFFWDICWNFYRVYVWHGPITPFLLSTIYYPPDQLYGPHCWSWEGGKTQHLPSFLEMERNYFLEFLRSHVPLFVVILLQHCGISKCKERLADLTKTTSITMADGRILHGTWKDRL